MKIWLQNFFRRDSHAAAGLLGVELNDEGICFAHVLRDASGQPTLSHCEFIPCEPDHDSRVAALKIRLEELDLLAVPAVAVLDPSQYQLLLVEAPKVDPTELRAAVRFRIKDLIDFHIDDAVIDVFDLPEDSGRSGAKMMYTVVAKNSIVQDVISTIEAVGLELQAIDVGELAMRNISALCPEEARGTALIRLYGGGGQLNLSRNSMLYFSRRLDLPFAAGLLDDIPEQQLVLELQRSIDYYERQMGQVPPAQILIGGEGVSPDKLSDSISDNFVGNVHFLNLAAILESAKEFEEHTTQQCLAAIGAALRVEEVAL